MIKRNTWILLIVFLALAAIALYYSRSGTNGIGSEDLTATPPVYLLNLESQTVNRIEIRDNSSGVVELQLDESGQWILITPDGSLDPEAGVEEKLNQLIRMQVLSELQTSPPPESTGLDSPDYTITLTLNDNTKEQLFVGHSTITGSGYYVQTSMGNVSVVSKSAIDSMVTWVQYPPLVTPEAPVGTETGIPSSVQVTSTP